MLTILTLFVVIAVFTQIRVAEVAVSYRHQVAVLKVGGLDGHGWHIGTYFQGSTEHHPATSWANVVINVINGFVWQQFS